MPARKQQTHAKRAREGPVHESVAEDTPAPDEVEATPILMEQESR
jgi:hypothetical protein